MQRRSCTDALVMAHGVRIPLCCFWHVTMYRRPRSNWRWQNGASRQPTMATSPSLAARRLPESTTARPRVRVVRGSRRQVPVTSYLWQCGLRLARARRRASREGISLPGAGHLLPMVVRLAALPPWTLPTRLAATPCRLFISQGQ
jgi:hypothetical protein